MTARYQIQFQPVGKRVDVPAGVSLLKAAREAGLDLASACGGAGSCGQCRVVILEGDMTPPTPDEVFLLSAAERLQGIRLACCTRVCSDARVLIPKEALITGQRLQIESNLHPVAADPLIQAYPVELVPPTLEDPRADLARLVEALDPQQSLHLTASTAVIRTLSPRLREAQWQVTACVRRSEIVAITARGARPLGLAVDLGTTKIAASLVDLETGQDLASAGAPNPQLGYGEDVMTRLNYASRSVDGGQILAERVRSGLDCLLGELAAQAGVEREQVVEACIVGNTAMTHLLLNLPVRQLAMAPYVAAASGLEVPASELGLHLAAGAYVHIPPCIGGFVGADHVAMILASDLDRSERVTLGVDIGTNTEISLRVPGRPFLSAASCASGPAFEGAHIRDGMRAASGAIEKVRLTHHGPDLTTIDDVPAVGLCGSGIIDVMAELVRLGWIDRWGRLQAGPECIRDTQQGLELVLVPAERSGSGRDVLLTQKDIHEIQLAKGAIQAGLSILLEASQIAPTDVEEVIVAGAFGSFLNIHHAVAMGLFPALPGAEYRQVGNAAALGARWILISRQARQRAQEIAAHTRYTELTTFPKFSRRFALAMLFHPESKTV